MRYSTGMFSKKNLFRNAISVLLVALFGFSAVTNLFRRDTYVTKIGKYKISIRDIQEMGGHNEATAMNALRILSSFAYLSNEADALGLKVNTSDIQDRIKNMFQDGNGQFSKLKLDEYLDKAKMTNNGLIKLVTHIILAEQLFALVNNGMKLPRIFIERLMSGINQVRSGYVYEVNLSSIDESEVKRHLPEPTHDDLFKYLISNREGNGECYIFDVTEIEKVDLESGLDAVITKYKHEKVTLTGDYLFTESFGEVKWTDLKLDPKYYTTNVAEQNGKRYFIYYDPFSGQDMDKIRSKWASSTATKVMAAKVIADGIAQEINQMNISSDKISFVKDKFSFVEGVSLASCFHNQRCPECVGKEATCPRCSCNDCMCPQCFNEDNSMQISRISAISMLVGQEMIAMASSDEDGASVVFPIGHTIGNIVNDKDVDKTYTSGLHQNTQEFARVDIMQSPMT